MVAMPGSGWKRADRLCRALKNREIWLTVLEGLVPALLSVCALYFMAVSLLWRPVHDSPLMYYIGYLMEAHGAVPYVDIVDMNAPGTMLLHQGITKLIGNSEFGQRVVDLLVLTGIQLATYLYMRRWGWSVALMAAACFTLHYLGWTARHAFQREYICLLPLALSLLLAFRCPRWSLALRAFGVGLLFGVILSIKPPMLLGFPVVVVGLFTSDFADRRAENALGIGEFLSRRDTWIAAAMAVVGLAVVPLLCTIYLVRTGAWEAFQQLVREYWPLYSTLRGDASIRSDPWEPRRFRELIRVGLRYSFLAVTAMGLFGVLPRLTRNSRQDAIEMLTMFGLLCSFLAYIFLTGKFWKYHAYPAFFIFSLIAGLTLWPIRHGRRYPLEMAGRVVAIGLFAAITWKTPDQADRLLKGQRFAIHGDINHVATLLRTRLQPGDTVQPLDVVTGAVHAMLLAEAKMATPFMYEFYFYHHPKHRFIQKLRRRMIAEMKRKQPRFIVAGIPARWRPRGRNTAATFPELERIIASEYKLTWKGRRLSVYERRAVEATGATLERVGG